MLAQAVQYRLDMGTPQNLANILWSCVILGITPGREWMAMFYNALDVRWGTFHGGSMRNGLFRGVGCVALFHGESGSTWMFRWSTSCRVKAYCVGLTQKVEVGICGKGI